MIHFINATQEQGNALSFFVFNNILKMGANKILILCSFPQENSCIFPVHLLK